MPTGKEGRELMAGLKVGLLPNAAMVALAGTIPDFGVYVGAQFGLIVALATPEPRPRLWQRRTGQLDGIRSDSAISENV
jgi:hypothetical protein